jgi:ubiquinone/menaquinone biosynthesis C-methylase UbiE
MLDLAAGTGDTGFLAAAMIGDEGTSARGSSR